MRTLIVVIALLVPSALAAPAGAVTFVVNQTGDQVDASTATAACDVDTGTAGDQCTYRAALQQANASPFIIDVINFHDDLEGDTITVGASGVPEAAEGVIIDGSTACDDATPVPVPCVGLLGAGAAILEISGDGARVRGLSFRGTGGTAIVIDDALDVEVYDNWFGVAPDGTTLGFLSVGISTTGDSGNVGAAGDGNLFVGLTRAIEILGGDENNVWSNTFGYLPDGSTSTPTRVGIAVDIAGFRTDTGDPFDDAVDNTIGDDFGSGAGPCDGRCNVIGATKSNDAGSIRLSPDPGLSDFRRAADGVAIERNLIGVPLSGTCTGSSASPSILVGNAKDVRIGGEDLDERNVIGCSFQSLIVAGDAEGLTVTNNFIGVTADGASAAPGTESGVETDGDGGTISGNRFGGTQRGLTVLGAQNTIEDNEIGGTATADLGVNGIGVAMLDVDADGNLIRGNDIRGAATGVLVLGGDNTVIEDNDVREATEGILVQSTGTPPLGTIIGDVLPLDADRLENRIAGTEGDGIRLVGSDLTGTRIGVNTGSGVGGAGDLFIELGEDGEGNGPSGPSGGLEAPSALVATTTGVTVTAEPNATVYVYRRDGTGPRLDAFLGRTDADGSGTAVLPFSAALAPGTALAATQETTDGTSELRLGQVPFPPSGGGGDGGATPPPTTPIVEPPPGPPLTPPAGPSAPSAADQAKASKRNLDRILRALRRAKLRGLARRGRFTVPGIEALTAGTLTFRATSGRSGRAKSRAAAARRVVVLTGTVRFTTAGTKRLTIRVTKAGRRAVRGRRLALRTELRATPAGGAATRLTRSLTLRR